MKFEVLENGEPCSYERYTPGAMQEKMKAAGWVQHSFNKMEDALRHAESWLGHFAGHLPKDWDGQPLDYSGYGDTIEIREVK